MFEPLNKGHAISEATFFLEFDNIPTSALSEMLDSYRHVEDILPRNDAMPGMIFEQSGAGFSINQVPGAEWKHFKADGNPDWIARISPNSVSVHCMDYSGWTSVWPQAFKILSNIFRPCEKQFLPLINLGLRYADRFDFKGQSNEYDANHLVRKCNQYIAPKVLEHGSRWHNYTGWFEHSKTLGLDLIQQLNVDAVEHIGTNSPIVSITHASLLRSQKPNELDKFRHFSHIDDSPISQFMGIAHDNNHKLLRELLTDDMLKRIGLGLGG